MDRIELERIWATTAKHLIAARAQLPEVPAPGLDGATVSGFEECLRQNEMELALDELEDLGLTNAPPRTFGGTSSSPPRAWNFRNGAPISNGKWQTNEA
jgi:hypothetical protein